MSRFVDMIRNARSNEFAADIAKLSFGTLAGRLISFLILPILTRLYSPDDFSVLATYLAVLGITAVAACLRLDVAIPLSKSDEDAINLLALALSALGIVTLCSLLLVILIPNHLTLWLNKPHIGPYLLLIPIGIVLSGTYSAFQYWTTRSRQFGRIARTRITQSALGAATSTTLGFMGLAPFGLLLGNTFSVGAGGLGLAVGAFKSERGLVGSVSLVRMRETLRRYRRYPLYSTPDALLNIGGAQVPVIMISALEGSNAGFLLLAMQLMSAPMALLGSSISQVYMSRLPEAMNKGELSAFTMMIIKRLCLLGSAPLLLGGALAPLLVPYLFGSEWVRTGSYIQQMVPWVLLQFVVSPVSTVLYAVERQRAMLLMTAVGFVLRVGATAAALLFQLSGVTGLVGGSIAYYAVVLAFVLSAVRPSRHEIALLCKVFTDYRIWVPAFAFIASLYAY